MTGRPSPELREGSQMCERPHDLGGQGGPVGVEEGVQGPTEAIIVEERRLLGAETQEVRAVRLGPGPEPVEGLAREQEIP